MLFKAVLGGVVALPFLMGAPALAGNALFGVREAPPRTEQAPVILAQAADPRVSSLEEQVRQLNGRLEELNFQILQMQDQLRRMQEDNEFRFQELEEKRSDAGAGAGGGAPAQRAGSEQPAAETPTATAEAGDAPTRGEPPRTLGSVRFDADGNIVGGEVGEPAGQPDGGDIVAAVPSAGSADELYRNSYEFILSGDYKTAEAGFREHIERYPEDAKAADAHFWLGEAVLGQERYQESAEIFLRANRAYPDSRKGPDMLLKLGISLAAMNQRDVACATYREIGQRYPDVAGALKERVTQEQELAGC